MSEMHSRVWRPDGAAAAASIAGSSRLAQFLLIPLGGFVLLATTPWWGSALFFNGFDTDWTGFFLVPLFVLISLALGFWVSKGDPLLRWALLVGTVLKVAAAGANLYIVSVVYDQTADFLSYYRSGELLARQYQATGHMAFYLPFWSSALVRNLTGCLFVVTGPSLSGAMVLFALTGLWGQYFCYRAHRIAFPEGDRRLVGLTLFMLPSIIFWPAVLGKDAPLLFLLGLSAYGFAGLLRDPTLKFVACCGVGLLGIAMIRPHIAAMVASGFLTAYVAGRNLTGMAGMLRKLLLVPVLLVATFLLVSRAQSFLEAEGAGTAESALQKFARNNQRGGSAFGSGPSATSLLMSPFLLFRPFLWEAKSPQAAVASLEGTLLLFLLWRRRRAFWTAVRNFRSEPFVLFVLIYSLQVLLVFSVAITNFGLLARQRVMVMPMFLLLLAGSSTTAYTAQRD